MERTKGLVRMEDRRECSDKKIVSRCRERARRVYYGVVFEVKKQIPIEWIVRLRRAPGLTGGPMRALQIHASVLIAVVAHGNDATERDAAWEPLIDTPLHPEYPCAHCINSGTARVLEAEFGTEPNPLSMTSPTAPGIVHKWPNIEAYAQEVSLARIYGGLHYRNSTMVGEAMGKKIGELACQNFLKPAH